MTLRSAHRDLRDAVREVGLALVQVVCAYVGLVRTATQVAIGPPEETWGVWCAKTRGGPYPSDAWLTEHLGCGPPIRMTEEQARTRAKILNRTGAKIGDWRYEARPIGARIRP